MLPRRAEILDAAALLIGEHGYAQTSIDEVIRHAGLSGKSHFYHYFKSKEALGYEVLSRQFERFTEHALAILREPMIDPLERLFQFIDALVASQAKRGCRGCGTGFSSLASELADCHEGFRCRIEQVFERFAEQVQSLLWEVRPRMRDDVDTARMARFIIATLEGAVLMSRVKRDIVVMEGVAEDLKRFVLTHLREGAAHV